MITVQQISSADDIAALRKLLRTFTSWAMSIDPDTEDAPTFDRLEKEIAGLPGEYAPPLGCSLLARDNGVPVGCVAFAPRGESVVELKRMFVVPEARGKGIGFELVGTLIEHAHARKAERIVLDSYHTMVDAHHIYRSFGFVDVAAPPEFPEDLVDKVVFMELELQ